MVHDGRTVGVLLADEAGGVRGRSAGSTSSSGWDFGTMTAWASRHSGRAGFEGAVAPDLFVHHSGRLTGRFRGTASTREAAGGEPSQVRRDMGNTPATRAMKALKPLESSRNKEEPETGIEPCNEHIFTLMGNPVAQTARKRRHGGTSCRTFPSSSFRSVFHRWLKNLWIRRATAEREPRELTRSGYGC